MQRPCGKRGTTLVELMACLVFLGVAVYPILTCITQAQANALNAQERLIATGLVQDQIENQRATALASTLTAGTTTTTYTPTGVYTPVVVTTVIALVSGYSNLYSVTVTATWGNATLPERNGPLTLVEYMEGNHA